MPCRDYYDDHPEAYFRDVTEPALKARISFAESALCQVLTAFSQVLLYKAKENNIVEDVFDMIDYAEAGITKKELKKWWGEHRARDAKIKAEKVSQLKESALAKLTAEEKKALGL
jgi:hypothetical protein